MQPKSGFFRSLGKEKSYVVLNLFYAYLALGLVLIMLGSILPDLKTDYHLSYQVGGMLLSVQSVGYVLSGLGAGFLPLYLGMKRSFLLIVASMCVGFGMLLVSGNPVWLMVAMVLIGLSKGGITNYDNLLMSRYSGGNAGPMNMLHACFAIGAVSAPIIVLVCSGWRMAVVVGTILAGLSFVLMLRMKVEDDEQKANGEKKPVSYRFFKERIFIVTVLIVFFYQAVEASLMGWLTTFLIDSGVMTDASAQMVTSVLWVSLLAGRLSCIALAARFKPWQMIPVMAAGHVIFLALMLLSHSFPAMLVSIIGLGLSMSGMYGTSVSNAGDLFERYPVCMGFFVMLTSLGAVVAPSAVGAIANLTDIHTGMTVLLVFALALLASAVINAVQSARKKMAKNG